MAFDHPITTPTAADTRLAGLERVCVVIQPGGDDIEVYYGIVPTTATGEVCGDVTRRHASTRLAKFKDLVFDGITVAQAVATLKKLGKKIAKDKESP